MFCMHCGTKLSDEAASCFKCGKAKASGGSQGTAKQQTGRGEHSSPESGGLTNRINRYLNQTNEANVTFNAAIDPNKLRQEINENRSLRSELVKQGQHIVEPLLQATEPILKQRAGLTKAPIAQTNPAMYKKITNESVQALMQNAMELVREIGKDAEKPLIDALTKSTSLCVRAQSALCLGIAAVRSRDSVPYLKMVLYDKNESMLLRIASAAALLNNDDTDEATWNQAMQFLKTYADSFYPSWEDKSKREGMDAQMALTTLVQIAIPVNLVAVYST